MFIYQLKQSCKKKKRVKYKIYRNLDVERVFDMAANTNLHKAKDAKNDEFYTRLEDMKVIGGVVLCENLIRIH